MSARLVLPYTFTIYSDIVAAFVVMAALWPLLAPHALGVMRGLRHGGLLACLPWLRTRYAVLREFGGALPAAAIL